MDSANSGSMQSSSAAGDEEYDSRADPSSSSISALLNPQQTHVGPFTPHVFDPLSNYLDPTQTHPNQNQNQIINLDMVWSKGADLAAFIPPCSSSHNNNQTFLLTQLGAGQSQTRGVTTLPAASPPRGLVVSNEQNSTNTNAVRNPKKRSRASRRAPTTVLTTDTTNFRAMVQEFTGIPAPPFTSSSFPRTRLDLFASSSATRSASTYLEQTQTQAPPNLLRPFAHKVQASIPPSISFPPILNTLSSNNSPSSINYQHHSLNMHNPILALQSILQPPPLGNNNSSVLVASKTPQPSLEIPPTAVETSHLKMGGLEELGLSHAHVAAHPQNINIVSSSSDAELSRVNNNMNAPSSVEWTQTQAQRIGNNDGGILRSISGATLSYRTNVSDQRGKVNFSGTNADFHGDKGPECAVAARSEGMVESWINCSSD